MYQKLFYTDFTTQLSSAESMVEFMLEVELALVKAQEQNGIVPQGTFSSIEAIFNNVSLDLEVLSAKIPLSGNAAAPFVKQVIAEVKKQNPEASKYIHLGATSQDIVDTATMLKAKRFLEWLFERVSKLEGHLFQLANHHRSTMMIGRTLMQQARPITFGLKAANWLVGICNVKSQLASAQSRLLCVQLGGAVGSQNQYLTNEVRQAFAEALGLKNAPNWHTQRENIAAFASALGILSGSMGKIARDIVLLSQTEVGEVFEPASEGRGTSSTMPHKRNPVLSTVILANAHRVPFLVATILAAMPQAYERSVGLWHSEWETLDDIIGLTAGALEKAITLTGGLEINPGRMLQNIELTQGLIFAETVALALAKKLGKQEAYNLIKSACKRVTDEKKHLKEVLKNMDLGFSNEELNDLFKPENAIGQSLVIVDEVLAKK